MKNVFRLVGGLFAVIGLTFLIVSAFLWQRDSDFGAGATKTRGTVIELVRHVERDREHAPGVSYTAIITFKDARGQRREFSESVRSNPPRFAVGDDIAILYDPSRPSRAVVDDFWGRSGVFTIFAVLGGIFAVLGAVLLVIDLKRGRKISRLLRNGRPIEADFLHVFRDTRISRNGDHPFRIVAQAADSATGHLRRFESEAIWVDPTAQLTGKKLRVLIDAVDPHDYHVELPDRLAGGR